MKIHNIIGMFSVSLLIVFSSDSIAQSIEQKLKECSEINVSLIRLQCYDRITKNPEVQITQPDRERKGLLSRIARGADKKTDDEPEKKESETETVKNDSPESSKSDDNFGLIIRDERESIQSKILGEFKGWDGYTKFELENGQVWQQSSAGVLRVKINNPTITIKRSRVSDTYMLRVEGLNSSVRVKRIE